MVVAAATDRGTSPAADDRSVSVDDEGPQGPDTEEQRIFEPLVRGPDDHPNLGTGSGLAPVAHLAALRDGRAWGEDRPGGGSSSRMLLASAAV